ncbi:hypothetical protein [Serratia aquatilis]|uniref:Uncharacterized protein n=1 Tax=Serratia aquatilis TaxID=1737515 RepID=A0ABV6E7H4_9GAMM
MGQIYTETMLVQTVTELGKGRGDPRRGWVSPAMEFYQVFYGRGMMQLTWPENYQKYGKFQGSIPLPDLVQGIQYSDNRISRVSLHYWSDPK